MAAVTGLYAITRTPASQLPRLLEEVRQALRGGARVVQLRDKSREAGARLEAGLRLNALCRAHGALFLVNDDVALAAACGAHGVHLGRDDASIAAARARLGRTAVIGASCYNRLGLARRAVEAGADYVAFGRFFPSITKPEAVSADASLLRRARLELAVPVVAIGGITVANAGSLIEAGARAVAVIEGLFGAPDIAARAREFAGLFRRHSTR